jgi:hypothetical protein
LRNTEAILGSGEVRLGGKPIRRVIWAEAEDRNGAAKQTCLSASI